ncbi:MAG TPA: response regulator [Bryobacteraceae bacterium]|nr:response regulator [Bryobacteraceae bacterium]
MSERKIPAPYTPSILLVDDEDEVRGAFHRVLEELGYYIVEAANGRQAENAVSDRFFDLVVLDLSMPDEDGIELIRRFRVHLPQVKFLAVSGFMRGSFLHIARKLGASSVLQKPVSEEVLVKAVCGVLAGN